MSNVWAGISSQAKVIKDGVSATIGNGQRTLFWDHAWAAEYCLSDKATSTIPDSILGATVSELWDKDSGWKWDLFANFLDKDELLKIAAFSLFPDPGKEDMFYWNATSSDTMGPWGDGGGQWRRSAPAKVVADDGSGGIVKLRKLKAELRELEVELVRALAVRVMLAFANMCSISSRSW
ncbi:hypothetical protein KSS87_015468 [Heliosperma pusillum]|nr:hypothetical protein KSS87_015468 [Heliosperma pusillum]